MNEKIIKKKIKNYKTKGELNLNKLKLENVDD